MKSIIIISLIIVFPLLIFSQELSDLEKQRNQMQQHIKYFQDHKNLLLKKISKLEHKNMEMEQAMEKIKVDI